MCVIVRASPHAAPVRFRRPKKRGVCILFAHTQKTHTHFSHCPSIPHIDAAPYIPMTTHTKKAPHLSAER